MTLTKVTLSQEKQGSWSEELKKWELGVEGNYPIENPNLLGWGITALCNQEKKIFFQYGFSFNTFKHNGADFIVGKQNLVQHNVEFIQCQYISLLTGVKLSKNFSANNKHKKIGVVLGQQLDFLELNSFRKEDIRIISHTGNKISKNQKSGFTNGINSGIYGGFFIQIPFKSGTFGIYPNYSVTVISIGNKTSEHNIYRRRHLMFRILYQKR